MKLFKMLRLSKLIHSITIYMSIFHTVTMSLPVVHAPESLPPPLQSLRQLAYVSSAIDNALDDDQLYDIAQICQRRNAEYNLTGLLIYRDGSVFQILEGKKTFYRHNFNRY